MHFLGASSESSAKTFLLLHLWLISCALVSSLIGLLHAHILLTWWSLYCQLHLCWPALIFSSSSRSVRGCQWCWDLCHASAIADGGFKAQYSWPKLLFDAFNLLKSTVLGDWQPSDKDSTVNWKLENSKYRQGRLEDVFQMFISAEMRPHCQCLGQ